MASEQQAIGMMEGAFFVPKGDLISWVNNLLELEITCIEQLGTGAVYCQIVDSMFPGKVPIQRINWKAKNQWQFINNYKILQQSFAKCKIQKHIDIEKLSKSKYQDNLQFIQWMKRYYDLFNKNNVGKYEAKNARKNVVVDFSFVEFRNPKKKQMEKLQASIASRAKSKSPYDKIKPKINNRSVTVTKRDKAQIKAEKYLGKLSQIRQILRHNQKGKEEGVDKLARIQKIMEQIQEELPQTEQNILDEKLETVPSKSMLPSKKQTRVPQIKKK